MWAVIKPGTCWPVVSMCLVIIFHPGWQCVFACLRVYAHAHVLPSNGKHTINTCTNIFNSEIPVNENSSI